MLYANDNKTNMLFKTLEGGEETVSPYFEVERLIKRIPEDIENEAIEIFYRSKHRTGRFRILTTDLCDINVVVPSNDTARIQEMHILIIHTICAVVDGAF